MTQKLERLRARAISQTLFAPVSLKAAIDRLGFVQADPIKAPAPAQDLILRHRVTNYQAGDLDRNYATLDIEEDMFYAYGFLPRKNWRLLHPRDASKLPKLEKNVLDTVRQFAQMHPSELEVHFGGERVINAWGGYSKATTRALDSLHYRGLLRIARREKGIRVYEAVSSTHSPLSVDIRSRELVMVVAEILSPIPQKSLQETIARVWHATPEHLDTQFVLQELFDSGKLLRETIDGITWVLTSHHGEGDEVPRTVKFLAPFDPVVWDRRRFEYLWGWQYRFEAYTPIAKRVRGYYAMPLLWGEKIIGWANVANDAGRLSVELGFVEKRPKETAFRAELELEIERMKSFLQKPATRSSKTKTTE